MAQYFSFNGRISRENFWKILIGGGLSAFLLISLIGFLSFLLTMLIGIKLPSVVTTILSFVVGVSLVVVTVAGTAKRFHDRDKSGWWTLIGLIPVLGFWWILIECGFLKGTTGSNQYGSDPLEATPSATVN